MNKGKFKNILSILSYILVPIWIAILIPAIPFIIIYTIITDKVNVRRFKKKYPTKRFLIINKNDPDYLKVYSETLEKRIGADSVVLNEIDLKKQEYRFEKKLYKSGLSWKNYLPALIHVDNTISRIGLYYAFKDYLKGKRKRINKIFKNLNTIDERVKAPNNV